MTRATIRHSSRVLVLDSRNRIFLFQGSGLGEDASFWLPPGGGLEEGETHEAAALRELAEEVGLLEATLEACVWHRTAVFRWGSEFFESRERWFVCRVESLDLTGHINPDTAEQALTLGHRWWSLEEIASATQEVFVPRELARLLGPVVHGEYPATPLQIGL